MPERPEETLTMKMRGRPVTHDEAEASAQRLINSHFGNVDGARVSIPARPDNDDILVMDYIAEQRKGESIRGELLEALKGLAADVEKIARDSFSTVGGDFEFDYRYEDPDGYAVWSAARTAIAKAEGRA